MLLVNNSSGPFVTLRLPVSSLVILTVSFGQIARLVDDLLRAGLFATMNKVCKEQQV